MPRFRLRPGEVEAVQFDGNNWVEMTNFTGIRTDGDGYQIPVFNKIGTFLLTIFNPEGVNAKAELWVESSQKHFYVHVGDWVVKGALIRIGEKGFHLMKDDLFQKLYESVEENDGD